MPEPLDITNQFPNNPDITSELTTAAISQATPYGYQEDPYANALVGAHNAAFTPQEIGPQGAALYPGLSHNINVGGTSGSIIGSGNIYIPGGNIMPLDPLLQRRKAIDDAVRQRAASITPFETPAPFELKDPRVQDKFNQQYYNTVNSMVDKAYEEYGKDAGLVLSDQNTRAGREMAQVVSNYETLGKQYNQIVDAVSTMEQDLIDKTKIYTPEALKTFNEFKNLLGDFDKAELFAEKDLTDLWRRFQGYRSFENYIQDGQFLNQIKGKLTQYGYNTDKGEFYAVGTGKSVKFGDAIKEVVDSVMRDFSPEIQSGVYGNTEDEVRSYFEKAIGARLKDSYEQTRSISMKPQGSGVTIDSNGTYFGADENATTKNYNYDESGNIIGETTHGVAFAADFNTPDLNGKNAYIIDDIKTIGNDQNLLPGATKAQFSGVQVIEHGGNGGKEVVFNTTMKAPMKKYYAPEIVDGENTGKMREASPQEYKSSKDKNSFTVKEEDVVIKKQVRANDHTVKQLRNQIPEGERENFDQMMQKAYNEANKSNQPTTTTSSTGGAY